MLRLQMEGNVETTCQSVQVNAEVEAEAGFLNL